MRTRFRIKKTPLVQQLEQAAFLFLDYFWVKFLSAQTPPVFSAYLKTCLFAKIFSVTFNVHI